MDHPAGAAPGGPGHGRAGVRGAGPLRHPGVAGGGGLRPGAVRPAATRPGAVRPGRRLDGLPGPGRPGHPGLAARRAAGCSRRIPGNPRKELAAGGRLRAAPRAGRDVPGRNADHDRAGRPVRAGDRPPAAAAAHPAGRTDRLLPRPGAGLPRLVRRLARPVELHHVQRRVPVRPGRRLRLLPGPGPAGLREAAVPLSAGRAAQRGLLHLEPAVAAVDLRSPGRDVQGRGGARFQPADPAPPAGRLRGRGGPRLPLRVLAGPRRRTGKILPGLPAVPQLRPARPAGLRLDRRTRLPGPGAAAGPGRVLYGLRPVVLRAGPGVRRGAAAWPGRPRRGQGPARIQGQAGPRRRAAVHGRRGARARPPGGVRHLRLALPAAAAQPDPGRRGTRRGRDRSPVN